VPVSKQHLLACSARCSACDGNERCVRGGSTGTRASGGRRVSHSISLDPVSQGRGKRAGSTLRREFPHRHSPEWVHPSATDPLFFRIAARASCRIFLSAHVSRRSKGIQLSAVLLFTEPRSSCVSVFSVADASRGHFLRSVELICWGLSFDRPRAAHAKLAASTPSSLIRRCQLSIIRTADARLTFKHMQTHTSDTRMSLNAFSQST